MIGENTEDFYSANCNDRSINVDVCDLRQGEGVMI